MSGCQQNPNLSHTSAPPGSGEDDFSPRLAGTTQLDHINHGSNFNSSHFGIISMRVSHWAFPGKIIQKA